MFGLVAYAGSSDEGGASTSASDSDTSSLDSAGVRAAEAEARLKDYGKPDDAAPGALPSAFAAFEEVEGPPAFLNPEATRPLATAVDHGGVGAASGPSQAGSGKQERMAPGPGFDIAVLAPKLKGQKRQTTDPREMPSSAVIEGKAKRYKTEDGPEATQQYSAATIAMLGGKVNSGADDAAPGPRMPSKPMEVSEFLNKGIGAAQLPRKAQDRKDKEKVKRAKGQSAIGSWKTEAEMVLRQQFDS